MGSDRHSALDNPYALPLDAEHSAAQTRVAVRYLTGGLLVLGAAAVGGATASAETVVPAAPPQVDADGDGLWDAAPPPADGSTADPAATAPVVGLTQIPPGGGGSNLLAADAVPVNPPAPVQPPPTELAAEPATQPAPTVPAEAAAETPLTSAFGRNLGGTTNLGDPPPPFDAAAAAAAAQTPVTSAFGRNLSGGVRLGDPPPPSAPATTGIQIDPVPSAQAAPQQAPPPQQVAAAPAGAPVVEQPAAPPAAAPVEQPAAAPVVEQPAAPPAAAPVAEQPTAPQQQAATPPPAAPEQPVVAPAEPPPTAPSTGAPAQPAAEAQPQTAPPPAVEQQPAEAPVPPAAEPSSAAPPGGNGADLITVDLTPVVEHEVDQGGQLVVGGIPTGLKPAGGETELAPGVFVTITPDDRLLLSYRNGAPLVAFPGLPQIPVANAPQPAPVVAQPPAAQPEPAVAQPVPADPAPVAAQPPPAGPAPVVADPVPSEPASPAAQPVQAAAQPAPAPPAPAQPPAAQPEPVVAQPVPADPAPVAAQPPPAGPAPVVADPVPTEPTPSAARPEPVQVVAQPPAVQPEPAVQPGPADPAQVVAQSPPAGLAQVDAQPAPAGPAPAVVQPAAAGPVAADQVPVPASVSRPAPVRAPVQQPVVAPASPSGTPAREPVVLARSAVAGRSAAASVLPPATADLSPALQGVPDSLGLEFVPTSLAAVDLVSQQSTVGRVVPGQVRSLLAPTAPAPLPLPAPAPPAPLRAPALPTGGGGGASGRTSRTSTRRAESGDGVGQRPRSVDVRWTGGTPVPGAAPLPGTVRPSDEPGVVTPARNGWLWEPDAGRFIVGQVGSSPAQVTSSRPVADASGSVAAEPGPAASGPRPAVAEPGPAVEQPRPAVRGPRHALREDVGAVDAPTPSDAGPGAGWLVGMRVGRIAPADHPTVDLPLVERPVSGLSATGNPLDARSAELEAAKGAPVRDARVWAGVAGTTRLNPLDERRMRPPAPSASAPLPADATGCAPIDRNAPDLVEAALERVRCLDRPNPLDVARDRADREVGTPLRQVALSTGPNVLDEARRAARARRATPLDEVTRPPNPLELRSREETAGPEPVQPDTAGDADPSVRLLRVEVPVSGQPAAATAPPHPDRPKSLVAPGAEEPVPAADGRNAGGNVLDIRRRSRLVPMGPPPLAPRPPNPLDERRQSGN